MADKSINFTGAAVGNNTITQLPGTDFWVSAGGTFTNVFMSPTKGIWSMWVVNRGGVSGVPNGSFQLDADGNETVIDGTYESVGGLIATVS